ncbi:MAG: hypothetical protein IKC20_06725 [Clostridia bacterium]|nr:hypothetical protein [Clostridia bacterium]
MKKTLKKLLCVILCAVLLFTSASIAFAVNAVRTVVDSENLMVTSAKAIENDSSSVFKNISDTLGFGFMFSLYILETVMMYPIIIVGMILSLFGVDV